MWLPTSDMHNDNIIDLFIANQSQNIGQSF